MFKKYVLENGVDNEHIIEIALDGIENGDLRNPKKCYQYIKDVVERNNIQNVDDKGRKYVGANLEYYFSDVG